MRMRLLAAGIAAAALFPSMAFAQSTCEQQHSNRILGTVAGGAIGAIAGNAIAGHGNRTAGTVIGAVGGAIVGNQLTKPSADCAHAYGYYDNQNSWHANAVDHSAASGYYDRDGQWVEGAPNGYYDQSGRWIAANSNAAQSGYYDSKGFWVPASASGYYDSDGQWIAGAASGHYDNGRWVAGPTTGRYDSNGRWMAGSSNGHRDANGAWIADPQSGYYDANGRWQAGPSNGYYDGGGRWIATSASMPDNRDRWNEQRGDTQSRQAWLSQRIRDGRNSGDLTSSQARRFSHTLQTISYREARMRHYRGRLGVRDERTIQAQLDTLSADLRAELRS